MNLVKICKIIPLLDSSNDGEVLAALRALQRALAPETFGDVARLLEEGLAGPEVVAAPERPFAGFKPAAQPPRVKPMKPLGDGWVWNEYAWQWREADRPLHSRKFQTLKWEDPFWKVITDYPKVMAAAMEVMNGKLPRGVKTRMESVFVSAMSELQISLYLLNELESIELSHARANVRYTNV